MKNKDKHPIDELFEKGLYQEYPYDPALWEKAAEQLAAKKSNHKIFIWFAGIGAALSLMIVLFWANINPEQQQGQPLASVTPDNGVATHATKETASTASEPTADPQPSDGQPIVPEGSPNTLSASEFNSSSRKTDLTQTPDENLPSDDAGEPENNPVTKPTPVETYVPETGSKAEDPAVKIPEKITETPIQTLDFLNWDLTHKEVTGFTYTLRGKPDFTPFSTRVRRPLYTIHLEWEQMFKQKNQYNLSGLPDGQLQYRRLFESGGDMQSNLLNVMVQRGNWGIVSGFGIMQSSFNTQYKVNQKQYKFETRYEMLKESIPYSGGTYSLIKEYQDTTLVSSEDKLLEGQSEANKLNWFMVPLKVSYQYPWMRFRFSVRAGANLMFLQNAEGNLINSDRTALVAIGSAEAMPNKTSISASAGLYAGYMLNTNLQVGLSYSFNKQLISSFKGYSATLSGRGFGTVLRYTLK